MKHVYTADKYQFPFQKNNDNNPVVKTEPRVPNRNTVNNILAFSKAYESKESKLVERLTTLLN